MAISRRAILKLGVSYGTGVINHGNDSIAYERELRKLAENPAFGNFERAMEQAEEIMAAAAVAEPAEPAEAAEVAEVTKVTASAKAAGAAESAAPDEPQNQAGPAGETEAAAPVAETAEAAASTDKAAEEALHENPLRDIIAEAKRFRDVCSQLALSSLYLQMTNVINAMQEECLPAVDDLVKIKQDYNAILDYLKHC